MEEATLVHVKQEAGEHGDVIQPSLGLTLFYCDTQSHGSRQLGLLSILPASSDQEWQVSPCLPLIDWISELHVGVRIQCFCAEHVTVLPRGCLQSCLISVVAPGAPGSLVSCGCGTGKGDQREQQGRRGVETAQRHRTVFIALC